MLNSDLLYPHPTPKKQGWIMCGSDPARPFSLQITHHGSLNPEAPSSLHQANPGRRNQPISQGRIASCRTQQRPEYGHDGQMNGGVIAQQGVPNLPFTPVFTG